MDYKTLSNILLEEIPYSLIKKLWIEDNDWSGLPASEIRYQYNVKTMKEFYEEVLREQFEYFIDKFQDFPDPFPIYREMGVEDINEFLTKLRRDEYYGKYTGLGIYWSWDKESAKQQWEYRKGGYIIFLIATVFKKDVNWVQTIVANLSHSTGEDEKEITLKSKSPVILKEIEIYKKDEYGLPIDESRRVIRLDKQFRSNPRRRMR